MPETLQAPRRSRAPSRPLPVAFLGLGAMGEPMCRRLVTTHDVAVFDVDRDRCAALAELGARSAGRPCEAARGAEVVVLAVRTPEQVHAALFGPDGAAAALPDGAIVILTSTIGPEAAREVERALAPCGAELLDAPVSGGPARAATGELLVMAAGRPELLERAAPVLDLLATSVSHVGPAAGDGQAMKAVNQLLCGVHIAAAAEALALARGLGLDPAVALEVLGGGAAASFMLRDRGPRMLAAGDGGAEVRSRLDIFVKDMGIVAGVARAARVPTPVAAAAEQLFALGHTAGLAARDDSSVISLLTTNP